MRCRGIFFAIHTKKALMEVSFVCRKLFKKILQKRSHFAFSNVYIYGEGNSALLPACFPQFSVIISRKPTGDTIMRELNVYYCPKCGRYAYHHIPKNAVCPTCSISMTLLNVNYQSFMDMDYGMRDHLIADQIIGDIIPKSSVVQRIAANAQISCVRIDTAQLCAALKQLEEENQELQRKNKELEETNQWMHDLIWDLEKRLRAK